MTNKPSLGTVLAGAVALAFVLFTPALQSQAVHQSGTSASPDARSTFATNIEQQMRARGVDIRMQLDGDAWDTLQANWPAVHRGDIFRFVTSPIAQQARRMGFSKVIISNGIQRWEYDLTRESMISSPEAL